MTSVYEKISSALSALGKRKERDVDQQPAAKRAPQFRPWDQKALHKRLESYRPLTWFAKPSSVSSIVCASRGWVNEARETLCCEFCSARLVYPEAPYEQKQQAADMFSPSLTSKHSSTCPWKTTVCGDNLLAYTPSAPMDLCRQFEALQGKLLKIDVLPELNRVTEITELGEEPFARHVLGADPASQQQLNSPHGDVISSSILVQPGKLNMSQKAKLLALLGWDTDVLPPDASTAMQPLSQSSSYSLQHLLGKRQGSTVYAQAGAAAANGANAKHSMSSVVLKCHLCNSKIGLWNFASVKPSPIGRFSSSGAAPFLSPASLSMPASHGGGPGNDPLSCTIAGGSFGHVAVTARAAPRFGSTNQSDPVFGLGASVTQKAPTAATSAALLDASPLTNTSSKRKLADQDDPMSPTLDANKRAKLSTPFPPHPAGLATPGSAALPPMAPKNGSGSAWQPSMAATSSNSMAQTDQPLDPLGQHRNWCPWVYTGDPDHLTSKSPKFRCGWQYMLAALDREDPAVSVAAAAAASPLGAKELKNQVLHTIREM